VLADAPGVKGYRLSGRLVKVRYRRRSKKKKKKRRKKKKKK
jgi:hypothetical protein